MKPKVHGNLHPSLWGTSVSRSIFCDYTKSSPMASRAMLAWLQQFGLILVYDVGHIQKNRRFIKSLTLTELPTSSKWWEWQSQVEVFENIKPGQYSVYPRGQKNTVV